jgi:ribosomal protein uL13
MKDSLEKQEKMENSKCIIIDGKDMILGRLGSNIAKRLLLGEEIKLVNCQDIVILGRKKFLVDKYKKKLSNKVVKQGPYYSRSPANMIKRAFRNMLPYKNKRGIEAMKRLKCYNSVPSVLISSDKQIINEAKINNEKTFYYTKMGDICRILGYNKDK